MRHSRQRSVLLTYILLLLLAGGMRLWLRVQHRQYTLNRRLIFALVEGDNEQALALVKEGADPNIRYAPTSIPSLTDIIQQLFHRSPPPTNDSPTAFSLACGAFWNDDFDTMDTQIHRPDAAPLVALMLMHGAHINDSDKEKWTPLIWAVSDDRSDTVGVLLGHGADVNAKNDKGETALLIAIQEAQEAKQPWENTVPGRMIQQLLAYAADPNLSTENGDTPLQVASGIPGLMTLLRHHGARIGSQ
jgi:hypothetical protein